MNRGFSLLESLLSLSLSLVVVLAGLEFFGVSRAFFFRLKDRSEERQSALAALDKIAEDVRRAGAELAEPARLGLTESLSADAARLHVERCEKELEPASDIQPGQTRLTVADASGIKRGRRVCIFDERQGQAFVVASVEDNSLLLSPAADSLYLKNESRILLLETVDYYLEDETGVIRRKENDGSGQPLLEGVSLFQCAADAERNLVTVRLAKRSEKEKTHETILYPKNLAPVFRQ